MISTILPNNILVHFILREVEDLCEIKLKREVLHINLEEKNELPPGYLGSDYESKGFYAPKRIQDFPIRGKAVFLVIRRRRWRHKVTKQEIKSDYSFIAEGSKLTEELSAFLKGTGRDPSRYH